MGHIHLRGAPGQCGTHLRGGSGQYGTHLRGAPGQCGAHLPVGQRLVATHVESVYLERVQ